METYRLFLDAGLKATILQRDITLSTQSPFDYYKLPQAAEMNQIYQGFQWIYIKPGRSRFFFPYIPPQDRPESVFGLTAFLQIAIAKRLNGDLEAFHKDFSEAVTEVAKSGEQIDVRPFIPFSRRAGEILAKYLPRAR
jgi:hypothetical protein